MFRLPDKRFLGVKSLDLGDTGEVYSFGLSMQSLETLIDWFLEFVS
jgi:hypothetical protein